MSTAEKPIPSMFQDRKVIAETPVPYDSSKYESEAHYLAYLAGTSSLWGRLPRLDYLRDQGVPIPDINQFIPF